MPSFDVGSGKLNNRASSRTSLQSPEESHQINIWCYKVYHKNPWDIVSNTSKAYVIQTKVCAKRLHVVMVPLAPNPDFIGRSDILEMLEETFAHKNNAPKRRGSSQLSLYGLGGVG